VIALAPRLVGVVARQVDLGPEVTRTQAEEFIARARSDAKEERLNLPKGRKTALTFERGASDYLVRMEDTGGRNLIAKRRQLRLYLSPFFGSQRLNAITSFTVDRYKKRRIAAGASNGTINLELATLSHLFNKATEWRWLKAMPCRIRMLPKATGRIIALTDEQATALLDGAIADEKPQCWLFVVFGLNTAMRHGEILRSRFDQLDTDNHRLYIPQSKAGRREQPITPELADIFAKERETSDDPRWLDIPFSSPQRQLCGTQGTHERAVSSGSGPC